MVTYLVKRHNYKKRTSPKNAILISPKNVKSNSLQD